jgi:hypothetical protein
MKTDGYTKAVLTVIAIGVVFLVFAQKPVKEAQAFTGGGETISAGPEGVYHLKNGKIRWCHNKYTPKAVSCYPWSN